MPDNQITLSMLGGFEVDASGLPVRGALRKKLLEEMHKAAAGEGLGVYDLGGRLLDFVGESLRKPVAGILGEVWRQRKELREIAEKRKDKRDVEGEVELFDHTISWALHPSVQLQANGVELCTMTFDCKATLKLELVHLVIKNAWITRIKMGKLASTITLQYKTLDLMPPCKAKINLPESFALPRGGIRLGGEPTAPA